MSLTDLTRPMMTVLVESEPWRQYLRYLVEEFEASEARYDQTGDARDQGFKRALRLVIDLPYTVATLESPLARSYADALKPLQRTRQQRRQARQAQRPPVPIQVPLRRSGLV